MLYRLSTIFRLKHGVVPLAPVTLVRALRERFDAHRRIRALDVSDLALRVGHRRHRLLDALLAVPSR
jgi:hypothetical protein